MATVQIAINATNTDTKVVSSDSTRRFLYIRNYSTSAQSMWVLFKNGGTATAGTGGEIEIIAGGEYTFGGPLPPSKLTLPRGFILPVCPQEEIHVITSTGTATGSIMTQ